MKSSPTRRPPAPAPGMQTRSPTPAPAAPQAAARPAAAAARTRRAPRGAAPAEPAACRPAAVGAKDRQFAINLARGLRVLRAFTPTEPILGNRELADRTGLPKATISRLTYTLTLLGYLNHSDRYHRYRLGPGVLTLGYPMLAALQIRQVARPYMETLARETRCTVNLGMRDRLQVVYVDTCRPERDNNAQPDIGSTRPLLATALGRALLIAESPAERQAALNRLRLHDPQRYAHDLPVWKSDLEAFARRGYTHSRGDWLQEIHAVAAPIRQPAHEPGLALNCTVVSRRLRADWLERNVVPLLLETVVRIERACGVVGTSEPDLR